MCYKGGKNKLRFKFVEENENLSKENKKSTIVLSVVKRWSALLSHTLKRKISITEPVFAVLPFKDVEWKSTGVAETRADAKAVTRLLQSARWPPGRSLGALLVFYDPVALMMSDEAIVLTGLLLGLNVIDSNLCIKVRYQCLLWVKVEGRLMMPWSKLFNTWLFHGKWRHGCLKCFPLTKQMLQASLKSELITRKPVTDSLTYNTKLIWFYLKWKREACDNEACRTHRRRLFAYKSVPWPQRF